MTTNIMTIRETAEYLKIREKTAYRLAAEGVLPGFKVGGSWRFRRADIDGWIEKKPTQKETKQNDRHPATRRASPPNLANCQ